MTDLLLREEQSVLGFALHDDLRNEQDPSS